MGKHGAGSIITRPKTKNLYLRYYRDGKQVQEATGTTDREEAQRLLNIALGNLAQGTASPVGAKSLTFEDLRAAYIADKPTRENYHGLKHLDTYFKGLTVKQINERDHVEKFVARRRKENCTDPTIRRNLTPLKKMFRLAVKRKKIAASDIPYFPSLADSDPAGGYITPELFAKTLKALPTATTTKTYNATHEKQRKFHDLRPFFTFMYSTGCRVGAAQKITWDMVSADCRVLTLPAEIVKNRTALLLVLDGPMLSPLATELRKRFRRSGEPVFDSTNYRPEWNKACAASGLRGYDEEKRVRLGDGGARIHDLRCSGAMNLLRAGVDESTVLKIGGWKTRAMLDRYNVATAEIIGDALSKAGQFVADRIASAK
jgi:integrase